MSCSNVGQPLASEFERRYGRPPGSDEHLVELERWRQLCKELLDECERLRAKLSIAEGAREEYRAALHAATYEEIDVPCREKALAYCEQLPPAEEVIAELERDF